MIRPCYLAVLLVAMVVLLATAEEDAGNTQANVESPDFSHNHVQQKRDAEESYEGSLGKFTPWYIMNTGEKRADGYGLKRTKPSRRLVTFQCTRKTAMCRNGGKGPRVTFLKGGGAMCACMCPFGYHEAQCQESWWNSKENRVDI